MSEPVSAQSPVPVAKPATADAAVSPLTKWPWIASAALALVAIALFAIFVSLGWHFVVKTAEDVEKDDWDQLIGLIGRIDTVTTLVLGAVLGVGVGAAKQSGETKLAVAAANTNSVEVGRQHDLATANRRIADHNRDAAETTRRDLDKTRAFLDHLVGGVERRRNDTSRFVDAQVATTITGAIPSKYFSPTDPLFDQLATEASTLLASLEQKYPR